MNNEIWLPIANYSNYNVSNLGNIKNIKRNKVLSCNTDKDGYLRTNIVHDNGRRIRIYVHIQVAYAFLGKRLNNNEINHIDENKANACLSNLEYISKRENLTYSAVGKHMRYTTLHRGRFQSSVFHCGKSIYLGRHNTELEAHNVAVKYLADNNIQNKYI
jgi:hypothetical protein